MKQIWLPLLVITFLINSSINAAPLLNDGPYVFEQARQRQVIWVCDGKKEEKIVSLIFPLSVDHCGMRATLWNPTTEEDNLLEYHGDFKVAAASDIHGQFDLFIKLLKNNHIIDSKGRWNFSNGHFVITGDIFDRGPKVTEALWFLYDLEKQAEKAGGKLHLLLGNHEVMVLNGDLRYLHDKYNKTAEILNKPFESLFAKKTVLGDWLRSRPVLIKVNGMLFAHGGFHPELAHKGISKETINQTFKQNLVKNEINHQRSGLGKYLHKKNGPIWYRGYFQKDGATGTQIDQLLKHFAVNQIVVGHTSQKQIETRYQGKVIAIDASMKNGEYGELLLWENNHFIRASLDGIQSSLINKK